MDKLVKYKLIRRVFFASIIVLMACNHSAHRNQFTVPDTNDIKEIVKAVAAYDSLANDTIPISVDLRKIRIFIANTYLDLPPPPGVSDVNIRHLINHYHPQPYYFGITDSLYLIFQNDTLKRFKLNDRLLPNIKLTTTTKQEPTNGPNKYLSAHFYEISIPIFSLDHKKAYVELDLHCPRCGKGFALYMENKNGRWRIVHQFMRWIN